MLKLFFYTLLVFLQPPIIQEINKEEVHDLIEKSSIDIIDLRTNKEFSQGSIKDSYNIDFQKLQNVLYKIFYPLIKRKNILSIVCQVTEVRRQV